MKGENSMSEGDAPVRVVLFGYVDRITIALASVIEQTGHRIVGVVTTAGTRRRPGLGYLGIVEHFASRADVVVSSHPARWASMVAALKPDLIVCGAFPWRIPSEVLALPRLGAINVHPSLLPMYRGPGGLAFGWMFRNDEREAGVTAHRMDADFDTGPILVQERYPITDDDDLDSVIPRMFQLAGPVLGRALAAVVAGEPGTPQLPGEGFYATWFEPEWRIIDWSRPARQVHNQVRSWVGFDMPRGAIGDIDGVPTNVVKTRLVDVPDTGAVPGSVLRRDANSLVVQCGDGPLEIVRWAPVGDGDAVG
jgi:methionyl-tRNA formyltransferase